MEPTNDVRLSHSEARHVKMESTFTDPGPYKEAHDRFIRFRSAVIATRASDKYNANVEVANAYIETPEHHLPVEILVRLIIRGRTWSQMEALGSKLIVEAAEAAGIMIVSNGSDGHSGLGMYEAGDLELVSA